MQQIHSTGSSGFLPVQIGNATITISSREIAEATDKEHKHVLRDIRAMLVGLYGKPGQTFADMLAEDGPKLDHPGIGVDVDERGYVAMITLDREHAMTLATGYDVKLRKRVVDLLSQYEGSNLVAVPNFSDPVAAARAWADQVEARRVAERTKAEIGTRREATAMNTASQAVKKAGRLQVELDRSRLYATVKRMEKLHHGLELKWRLLKQASIEMGIPPIDVFDANYGTVKAYHADVWREAYALEIPTIDGEATA